MTHAALRATDAKARRRAQTEFARPLVLEAGAGTGKTAILVARVLAWALGPGWQRNASAGTDADVAARVLERIVAITFTEAAAAEMAERLAEGLMDVARGQLPPGLLEDALPEPLFRAPRARALLGEVDRLQVRTIHAYCRRLLARFPLEAGLHPKLEVDADGSALAGIVREILEGKLRQAYAEPGDADFLALAEQGCGPGELEELLVQAQTAGLPPEALELDPLAPDAIERLLEDGRVALDEWLRSEDGALARVARSATVTHDTDQALRALGHELSATPSTRAGLEQLTEALRGDWDGRLRARLRAWARGQLIAGERRALGDAAQTFCERAAPLSEWLEVAHELRPERLHAARRVIGPLLAELREVLRTRGIATFDALLCDARRLVVEHPRTRARIQRDIDQLVVDEFQDTDNVQCELVRALAFGGDPDERPGLFLVGDPKQSIYGWRRADLSAYEHFVAELREQGGELHHLHVNFRSRPAILEEVERLIAPVMLAAPGLQPAYQELVAHRPPVAELPVVEHWVSWLWDAAAGAHRRPTAAQAAELEARALAADLVRLHERGVAWRDVGVLLRSRGELEVYLAALRDQGVPFDVEGDRSYYRRREIIDAGALVRCVVDPNDQLSLLTWLRSPSVGLPDAALLPLFARGFPALVARLGGDDDVVRAALATAVRDAAREVPDVPGLERIAGWERSVASALETLASLRDSFEGDPADVFVEKLRTWTLIEATEAGRTLGRYRVANLDRFLRRLADDLCASAGDASSLLRELRRRVREAEEEEEARPAAGGEDAVQVRTIHQAKGLDWDHVYLMQTHKGVALRESQRVCGTLDGRWEYRLYDAPTPGFARLRARFHEVARAEQVRTLYVAITRARERLVIAGSWSEGEPREPLDAANHAALMQHRTGDRPDLAERMGAQARGETSSETTVRWRFPALEPHATAPAGRHRSASGAGAPRVEANARILAQRRAEAEREMARPFRGAATGVTLELHREARDQGRSTSRGVAAAVGSAVHQILEGFDPDRDPVAERRRQQEELPGRLAALLPPETLGPALERGRIALERLNAGPLLERLRALGADVARELPVLCEPEADSDGPVACVAGVIDLLYRDPESGEWVVADYKTDRAQGEAEIAALRQRYSRQGAVYTRAIQRALGLPREPRFELWLLDAGRVILAPPVQSAAP